MILIRHIDIMSFRSILDLRFDVDNTLNLVAICGKNNVGKTNALRAIDLFFNPNTYDVTVGLQEILDVFSKDISDTFKIFKDNWNISFHVPSSAETFMIPITETMYLRIRQK